MVTFLQPLRGVAKSLISVMDRSDQFSCVQSCTQIKSVVIDSALMFCQDVSAGRLKQVFLTPKLLLFVAVCSLSSSILLVKDVAFVRKRLGSGGLCGCLTNPTKTLSLALASSDSAASPPPHGACNPQRAFSFNTVLQTDSCTAGETTSKPRAK